VIEGLTPLLFALALKQHGRVLGFGKHLGRSSAILQKDNLGIDIVFFNTLVHSSK